MTARVRSLFLSSASLSLIPSVLGRIHGIDPYNLPYKASSEPQYQYGYNNCTGRADSPTALCQTLWINSLDDFCLFAPHDTLDIGDAERDVVTYCTKAGHGARLMPEGTITGATLVKTPHYMQITGTGDFTKIHDTKGDSGGELDPHGYDSLGNPIGGVVIAPNPKNPAREIEILEWAMFISADQFCIKACYPQKDNSDKEYCPHIYDEMGCGWNMPGTYKEGLFETCEGDDTEPAGLSFSTKGTVTYTSTWSQGESPTPSAKTAGKSSDCVTQKTISPASYATTTKSTTKKTTTTVKPAVATATTKTTTTTSKHTTTTSKTTTTKKATTTTTTKKTTTTAKAATTKKSTTTTKAATTKKSTTTTKAATTKKTTTTTKAATTKSTTTTKAKRAEETPFQAKRDHHRHQDMRRNGGGFKMRDEFHEEI